MYEQNFKKYTNKIYILDKIIKIVSNKLQINDVLLQIKF